MEFSSALEFTDNSPYLSGSDAQRTMPITPNMGVDAFLAASASGMGTAFHNSSANMLPMSLTHVMAPVPMAGTAATIPVSMATPHVAASGVDAARIRNDLAEIFGDTHMFDNAMNQVCEYPAISFGTTPTTVASDDFMVYPQPLDKMHDNFLNELLPASVTASPAHSSFGAPTTVAAQTATQHPLFPDMGGNAFTSPEMMAAAMAAAVAATTPGAGVASFSLPASTTQAMFSPTIPGFAGMGDGAALFGQLGGYADGGISAANHMAYDDAAAAEAAAEAMDADMHGHAQTRGSNLSPFMLPPEMLDIAAPPASAQSTGGSTVNSGQSITGGFGSISLDADNQSSFQPPPRRAASYASRLSRMRPKRSLSSGKIANARMSPFASGPSTSVHPYMVPHHCASPGSIGEQQQHQQQPMASPRIDRLYSHSRSGSDALIAGLAGSELSRAQSIGSVQSSPFVGDEEDSSSNSSDASDNDESSEHASTLKRGGKTSGSGRIALTNEQRAVFFRWLYQNTHDPKPKGKERDRLRSIGNMSRGRFKTWFANARRRYFYVSTGADGKQKYTINERFRIACQRSNIEFE
ncbi:hypothetical protein LPJ81_001108 [Coemansia sp. IMI 209127]|nr:hypothetical protein LPJ81_001108 [Coemansia sp. IMI 209127]